MEMPLHPSNTLFVADIPSNVILEEFTAIFRAQEGFKNARLRKDRNSHIVGFADFEDVESASFAMETLQGYKWTKDDHGITIHYSHNVTHSKQTNERNNKTVPTRTERNSVASRDITENGTRTSPSISFMPDLVSPVQQSTPLQSNPSHPNFNYPNMFPNLPQDASSALYVEGLPTDATER